jgi:hypothetical protein
MLLACYLETNHIFITDYTKFINSWKTCYLYILTHITEIWTRRSTKSKTRVSDKIEELVKFRIESYIHVLSKKQLKSYDSIKSENE